MLTLPKHNRYDYIPIGERKDYSWPGGKRLAFCTTTNIEVVKKFLPVDITTTQLTEDVWKVEVFG